ncbi:hypothetical protein BDW02DRAFT_618343 [Decorospora gaudefroyi]|uniref:Lipocalin-like domain-containing protein n=1 Tax=Decorospora gaudefroyi TaxID=184978 RepID=A0A6A5KIG7_9PLEO|nr:hypothetical protein BDW02DRAFT_618343 [Decorospora gaudefroyi]
MRYSPTTPLTLLLITLAAALPSTPTPPTTQCTDAKILKALAGTYTLLNTSSTLNNTPIPDLPYGSNPVGLLIYTATGWMSATITATEPSLRPALTFPFQPNDTDADWALVGKHSIGYAGPLRVSRDVVGNETVGQLFHGPLVVANVPTWVGANQRRNYSVVEREEEGGVVRYLRIGSERGGGYRGVLWWRKVA